MELVKCLEKGGGCNFTTLPIGSLGDAHYCYAEHALTTCLGEMPAGENLLDQFFVQPVLGGFGEHWGGGKSEFS